MVEKRKPDFTKQTDEALTDVMIIQGKNLLVAWHNLRLSV